MRSVYPSVALICWVLFFTIAASTGNPSNGEIYWAKEKNEKIKFVSADELELTKNGTNLICKYTTETEQLRVVANVLGTPQALYFAIVKDGLQDDSGTVFVRTTANQIRISDQTINERWTMLCNLYQRRSDLIPSLLNSVGSVNFDKSALNVVKQARAEVGRAQFDPNRAPSDAVQLERFQQLQGQLGSALSQMLVASERYPQLKQSPTFLALQAQLEGTESRLSIERAEFSTAVKAYNSQITNPSLRRPFFASNPQEHAPPVVNFPNFGSPITAPTPQ